MDSTPLIVPLSLNEKYGVSDDGRVWRIAPSKIRLKSGRKLPYELKTHHVYVGGRKKQATIKLDNKIHIVSRLILESFVGPSPTSTHEAAHWDGNPFNNHISNLRWATAADNQADKERHGTKCEGQSHWAAVLTPDQALSIREAYLNKENSPRGRFRRGLRKQMAEEFGVSPSTVGKVGTGKNWNCLNEKYSAWSEKPQSS